MVFHKLQINTLVNISFFAAIVLVAVLMVVSQIELSKIEADSIRIISLRAPTARASASMNTALNSSLAALRGWMLLEEERFLIARRDSWQTIRHDEKRLFTLSQEWTNPQNVDRFSKIVHLLEQLENEQTHIEHLAHKPENIRSSEILFNSAAPLATSITDNITKMIDFTKTQPPSHERLALLAAMADFRGSFALSLAAIRDFLLSGEIRFKTAFEVHWSKNEESYGRLNTLIDHLTPFERSLLDAIEVRREAFQPLPEEMFVSRQSNEWNRANYLLKTTAVPIAYELVAALQEMVSNQNNLLEEDAQLLSKEAKRIRIFQVGFLSFFLGVTCYFGVTINKKYHVFRRDLDSRDALIDQNVLMATLDKEGTIMSMSNALCRTLGGTQQDFIGTQSHFFLSINNGSEMHAMISKSLMTGQIWHGEFRRETLENEEIWLSSAIIPIAMKGKGGGERGWYHNILEDITNRKRFEEVSVTDKLTALYNRRKFDATLDHEIKLARRRKTYLTLAIIDIDFFKKYNDHYGHPAGDTALVRTAAALRLSLSRPDDNVFRVGGEEFAIIFNSLDEKQSWDMLECIRESVEHLKIEHSQNEISAYVTISIGAKVCRADELMEKDAFYNEADRFLYTAKHTRNTVIVG
ncbi:MAG: diguanylate cyclase [bacterium]|nr:diguanylate cyclase [bacterium]